MQKKCDYEHHRNGFTLRMDGIVIDLFQTEFKIPELFTWSPCKW